MKLDAAYCQHSDHPLHMVGDLLILSHMLKPVFQQIGNKENKEKTLAKVLTLYCHGDIIHFVAPHGTARQKTLKALKYWA